MAEITGTSLVVFIQLLDEKIWLLKQHVASEEGSEAELTSAQDLLLSYAGVQHELRDSYNAARKTTGNLPPYGSLVRYRSVYPLRPRPPGMVKS